MLESCDAELAEEGAKSQYWNKGKRTTTIKTVYGEVVYALDCFSVPSNFWNGWCCMRWTGRPLSPTSTRTTSSARWWAVPQRWRKTSGPGRNGNWMSCCRGTKSWTGFWKTLREQFESEDQRCHVCENVPAIRAGAERYEDQGAAAGDEKDRGQAGWSLISSLGD